MDVQQGLPVVLLVLLSCSMTNGVLEYTYNNEVKQGGNVTVTWKADVRDAIGESALDEIRLFCPPLNANSSTESNIDSWLLKDSSITAGTATGGRINVGPLINMRVDCQLKFFVYDSRGFLSAASEGPGESVILRFKNGGAEPLQGHLALTGNPSELRATWVSSDVSDQDPGLWYHLTTDPPATATKVQAAAQTYAAGDMCGGLASIVSPRYFRDPGNVYTAVMTGLTPNSPYTYWYGSGNSSNNFIWSLKTTITSPQPITNTGSTTKCRILAFGDMGAWGSSQAAHADSSAKSVVELIENKFLYPNKRIDLVAHIGDISYARGQGYVWERFFYRIEHLATIAPYHVGIGNHEYDHTGTPSPNDPSGVEISYNPSWGNYGNDSDGECGVPMSRRFQMPTLGGSNSVFWYSHSVANVRMVWISTEHDLSPGSRQAMWLRNTLAAIDRSTQPWVIVAGHRALYNNEMRTVDTETPVQEHLRPFLNPVFADFGVNLYICGHYHNYVRSAPISRSGQPTTAGGTVHITVGTAGAELGSGKYTVQPWVMKNLTTYGLLSIETNGATDMTTRFIASDGSVLDTVTLNQIPIPTPATTSSPQSQSPSAAATTSSQSTSISGIGIGVGICVGIAAVAACIVLGVYCYIKRRDARRGNMTDARALQEDF